MNLRVKISLFQAFSVELLYLVPITLFDLLLPSFPSSFLPKLLLFSINSLQPCTDKILINTFHFLVGSSTTTEAVDSHQNNGSSARSSTNAGANEDDGNNSYCKLVLRHSPTHMHTMQCYNKSYICMSYIPPFHFCNFAISDLIKILFVCLRNFHKDAECYLKPP